MDLSKNNAVNAIDFQRLYKEEKRNARERRRRSLIVERDESHEANTETTSMLSSADTETKESCIGEKSFDFPPWSEKALLTVLRLDRMNDCLTTTTKPSNIYYTPNYLPVDDNGNGCDNNYQERLLEWLRMLPENMDIGNEAAANGKWTRLPHAQRRVALFDGRRLRRDNCQRNARCLDETSEDDDDGSRSRRETSKGDGEAIWFPPPLQQLVDRTVRSGIFPVRAPPNHILVNEYGPASLGILPHTDGPAYEPTTATISLGRGSVLLHFTPIIGHAVTVDGSNNKNNRTVKDANHNSVQVLLEGSGSLVVFEGEAYSDYKHSIAELGDRTFEHCDDQCLNADPGTAVRRDCNRISITIRRKK